MNSQPLISILISCHNSAATIDRCLQSVKNQTYVTWQIICVDDGSRDQTRQLLVEWQKELGPERLRIITHAKSLGLTVSLNEALWEAKGEVIARLDADDWWAPEKLMKQVAYLAEHSECGLLGTWYVNEVESAERVVKLPITHEEITKSIFHANPFGHSCVVIRSEVVKAVGGYNSTIHFGQDWDLWLRLWPKTKMANLPLPLCFRQVGTGISAERAWQQNIQALKTAHHYIQAYRQPWRHYPYLWVFLGSAVAPQWLKKMYARTTAH